jgi:hypothetical protein
VGRRLGQDSGMMLRNLLPFRPKTAIAALLASFVAVSFVVAQEDDGAERPLIAPMPTAPEEGRYLAGDEIEFWVDNQGDEVRLRFADNEEVFYLSGEPSSLGGRVFKYDTGDVALAVSGWGGLTLYTDAVPSGIPAEHTGDAPNLDPRPVTARETQTFAAELSRRLDTELDLEIGFAANWDRISRGNRVRTLAMDSMRNATYALETLSATPMTKAATASRIRIVRVIAAEAPAVKVENDTVTITFNANGEAWDRPSSRAIREAIESAHN